MAFNAINDCIFDFHKIGQPVYIINKPVLECVDRRSWNLACVQEPSQSTSAKYSKPLVLSGRRVKP